MNYKIVKRELNSMLEVGMLTNEGIIKSISTSFSASTIEAEFDRRDLKPIEIFLQAEDGEEFGTLPCHIEFQETLLDRLNKGINTIDRNSFTVCWTDGINYSQALCDIIYQQDQTERPTYLIAMGDYIVVPKETIDTATIVKNAMAAMRKDGIIKQSSEQTFIDEFLDSLYLNGSKEDGKYILTLEQATNAAKEVFKITENRINTNC